MSMVGKKRKRVVGNITWNRKQSQKEGLRVCVAKTHVNHSHCFRLYIPTLYSQRGEEVVKKNEICSITTFNAHDVKMMNTKRSDTKVLTGNNSEMWEIFPDL